jgi:hypothetical protein
MFRRLVIAAFVVSSVPLSAAEADSPKRPDSYSTKKICKVDKETGSRLGGVKRCRTRAEMEALKRETRLTVEKIQAFKPTMCPPDC